MNDKDIVIEFLKLCGLDYEKIEEGNLITTGTHSHTPESGAKFTSIGYDFIDFYFEFNRRGEMIRGAIDSHVAYMSENAKIIHEKDKRK